MPPPVDPSPGWAPGDPAALLLLLLGTLVQALGLDPALRWERAALGAGDWWRLATGSLVHLSWLHWLLNALALALLWALFRRRLSLLEWSLVPWVCVLGVGLGLWLLSPEVRWYVGLSGALHGLAVYACGRETLRGDGWAAAALAAIGAKLAWERLHPGTGLNPLDLGGPVLTVAHLYGAATGAVLVPVTALAADLGRRRRL